MAEQSPFLWHELVIGDQQTSGAFFSELFGWTRREVDAGPFGTYTLFEKNGQDVAGMMNPTPDTPGKDWHSYIAVENVDECAERVPSLGGRVLVAPMCQSWGACAPWLIPPEQSHTSYRRSTSDADGLEAERGNGVTFGWRSGCAG